MNPHKQIPADCVRSFGKLSRAEAAAPGGFEWRALCALAHLREAWCVADGHNKPLVEAAIRPLLQACEHNRIARHILTMGFDDGLAADLSEAVGLEAYPCGILRGPEAYQPSCDLPAGHAGPCGWVR